MGLTLNYLILFYVYSLNKTINTCNSFIKLARIRVN